MSERNTTRQKFADAGYDLSIDEIDILVTKLPWSLYETLFGRMLQPMKGMEPVCSRDEQIRAIHAEAECVAQNERAEKAEAERDQAISEVAKWGTRCGQADLALLRNLDASKFAVAMHERAERAEATIERLKWQMAAMWADPERDNAPSFDAYQERLDALWAERITP